MKTRIEYHSRAIVDKVEKHRRLARASKNPHTGEVDEEYVDLGWFVVLRDSPTALCFGTEQPELVPGQEVMLIIRTVPTPSRSAEGVDEGSPPT